MADETTEPPGAVTGGSLDLFSAPGSTSTRAHLFALD
jgi:hypothetical protein